MNALLASLHNHLILIASTPTSWASKILQRLISATAATPLWLHTSAFIATLAQKNAAATSKPMFFWRWLHAQSPQPITRAPAFPIRVIDVEETVSSRHGNVVFAKPTSWEFHTISHTWSKGVQSWSNIIACKMVEQSAGVAEADYNDLFRREDFRSHKCYAPFMDFLRLLRADGVKQVWLDALCINQASESGEKSQELQNMGSYYAKSLGCYVCAHGFGEGFETWKEKESELVMPRWFNRVWTFQEMLLPKTLTFILDIHPVIRRTINWCISQQAAQGVNGACKCAMGMHPFPQPRYLFSEDGEEDGEEEDIMDCASGDDEYRQKDNIKQRGIEIRCGSLPCSQCGGSALIRKAKDLKLLQQQWPDSMAPDLYFIERQCIVRLMVMAKEQLQRTVWKNCDENDEWKLLRLETVMQQRDAEEEETSTQQGNVGVGDDEHGWDPIQVVVEVSKRDCTHDEDRILSILGLLKLEGAVQLRAGKTLDAQLLHLAQQLTRANPTALLKLCVAQFAGHARPGMSWAPSLGAEGGFRTTGEEAPTAPSWQELRRYKHMYERQMEVEEGMESGLQQLGRVMRHFVRSVQVRSVMEDGSLLLCDARVLWECRFDRDGVDQNLFNLHLDSQFTFPFKAYFTPSSCLLHHRVFVAGRHTTLANQSMVRLEGAQLQGRLHSFRVCLLLLGTLQLPNEEKHEVMMVCVGKKQGGLALHKVGVAWLPGLEEAFSIVPPSASCTIGGFQDYMDRFVLDDPSAAAILCKSH